ncbi:MAG: type II secretion system F family protein [Planctomycetes bacterium]|nr:type II secretion system F family protein [Planctomycetota bacterium]
MPIFQYKAVDGENKVRKGIVDADSPREARIKLKRESLYVTELSEARKRGPRRMGLSGLSGVDAPNKARNEQVSAVTRQMASLLSAGIPLAEALRMVIEQAPDQRMEAVFRDIREKVTQGLSFGDAVLQHPAYFTELYSNMVKAGESSGALDKVMARLSTFLQSQARLKNKVGAAMIYPGIMMLIGVVVVSILMAFVVPQVTQMLRAQGKKLPFVTETLIGISEIFRGYWFLMAVAVLVGAILFNVIVSTDKGRLAWDAFKLRLPVFGDLMRKQAVARFSVTLATLLRSGVPALQAIETTRTVLDNRVLSGALKTVHDQILEGADIATPMKATGQFPPTVSYMIGVGEQAGNLEEMLERVADAYDEEVDLATQKLSAMLEPLIIVVLAVVVAGVVIAIVQPLMELTKVRR